MKELRLGDNVPDHEVQLRTISEARKLQKQTGPQC